jgi:hypothetical protein
MFPKDILSYSQLLMGTYDQVDTVILKKKYCPLDSRNLFDNYLYKLLKHFIQLYNSDRMDTFYRKYYLVPSLMVRNNLGYKLS